MTTAINRNGINRNGKGRARQPVAGVGRLVRRIEHERRRWMSRGVDEVATEQAWRAGVAEGLRLAQVAIRKGV